MLEAVFLWAAAGLLLGVSNIWMQKISLNKAGKVPDAQLLKEFSLYSILRVVTAVIVLFFGFRNGLYSGISCLAGFLIIRWLGLAVYLNKQKERG